MFGLHGHTTGKVTNTCKHMDWRESRGCVRYFCGVSVLHIADDSRHNPSLEKQQGYHCRKLKKVFYQPMKCHKKCHYSLHLENSIFRIFSVLYPAALSEEELKWLYRFFHSLQTSFDKNSHFTLQNTVLLFCCCLQKLVFTCKCETLVVIHIITHMN